jgi:hypothetical protein
MKSKEIIERGYLTNALTNEKNEIYGINKNHYINWEKNEIEKAHQFYWSEIYIDGNCYTIIKKGTLLVNPTWEELKDKFEQSKINLN